MMLYRTTEEIECAVARYFNPRVNLVVPNVSWGMGLHECDLLVLTKSGYAYEVEIKVSRADLIKDLEKRHGHHSNKIKKLYFAIPAHLAKHIEYIPLRAGIISVNSKGWCCLIKNPDINTAAHKLSDEDRFQFARLGALRIFDLKSRIINSINKCDYCRSSAKEAAE